MGETYLYHQISASIRQQILNGKLKPGDRLPSVRKMTTQWACSAGTVQRAYQDLARQGLVTSRAGQGTKVLEQLPSQAEMPLRRATLIHRAESFLLEVLTAGYTPPEIEEAVRQALDRWRILAPKTISPPSQTLHFCGSHDLVITWLASYFPEIYPGFNILLQFSGSLGGLFALAEGKADLAGCHLWDEESNTYNIPFVRRLLPGRRLALVTLAHRRLGLILPKGNPNQIDGLGDLTRLGLRFANRQIGSGSRVWLDANLRKAGISPDQINGYQDEKMTHLEMALAVAENEIDVGLGLEAAAESFGLDFIPLTLERYDLVLPGQSIESAPVRKLLDWLASPAAKDAIIKFGGYETQETGRLAWVE
jgi:putative molybdopterin biosynthesis protein